MSEEVSRLGLPIETIQRVLTLLAWAGWNIEAIQREAGNKWRADCRKKYPFLDIQEICEESELRKDEITVEYVSRQLDLVALERDFGPSLHRYIQASKVLQAGTCRRGGNTYYLGKTFGGISRYDPI